MATSVIESPKTTARTCWSAGSGGPGAGSVVRSCLVTFWGMAAWAPMPGRVQTTSAAITTAVTIGRAISSRFELSARCRRTGSSISLAEAAATAKVTANLAAKSVLPVRCDLDVMARKIG